MAGAIAAALVVAGWAPPPEAAEGASGAGTPRVTLAIVPGEFELSDLAATDRLSPGVLSAGIGEVTAERTYLDISAGARESPPSDAVPGLLGTTLRRAGASPSGFRIVEVALPELPAIADGLRAGDLLIALEAPPPPRNEGLAVGIAGSGFDGNLTSDSTRTDGYVLATDLAPTILERLGIPVPEEMNGEPIRSGGGVDLAAVEERADRMEAIPERRSPLVVGSLAAWIALAAIVSLLRPAVRGRALTWVALAFAYMPLTLLLGAALEPSALAEGAIVGLGAAALAWATLRLAPGWWSLAIACGATVLGYAIDVIAGSDLTTLSLLGPNPIHGVRFFGIGNELEALIAVMVPVGVGAGLTAIAGDRGQIDRRAAVTAFAGAAGVGAAIFAAGHWGADVGAAIVLPVGAAAAVAAIPRDRSSTALDRGRRTTPGQVGRRGLVGVGAAALGLAALVVIDLVSGGDAHLTRSVLDAGGAEDLADVAERRLRLSAGDFAQAAGNPLFWLVIVALVGALSRWRAIDARLRVVPLARAGLLGGIAATAAGVLVNDSGAIFLALGGLALGAFIAYAWARLDEHAKNV